MDEVGQAEGAADSRQQATSETDGGCAYCFWCRCCASIRRRMRFDSSHSNATAHPQPPNPVTVSVSLFKSEE
eukprot:1195057-Prorocentrum_minimum.AAC.9